MKHYQSNNSNPDRAEKRTVDLETLFVNYNEFHHPKGKDIFGRL